MSLKCDLKILTIKEIYNGYKKLIQPATPNTTTIEVLKHYLQVTEEHFSAAAGERQNTMQQSDAPVGAELQMEKIEAVKPDGHTG